MVIAVLGARYGVSLAQSEVYLNVAGGLYIEEPAADLAVAAALLSALFNTPLPEGLVVFGELALSGEVRLVPQSDARLREAAKLGFSEGLVPPLPQQENNAFLLHEIRHIRALSRFFVARSDAS
jgi:DNA repair protein RadA/Sms